MTLRELRLQAGMTRAQLAANAGVNFFTVCNIEQGRGRRRPRQATLTRLAWALGVEVGMIELPRRGRPEAKDV